MEKLYPCLAHITQIPQCLDLPRINFPANFHYTGPFISNAARPRVEFPWHCLDGRPLIYASLGTTRNIQPSVFRMIAEACRGLNAQLVISLGGRFEPESFGDLPGFPLLVRYAPQLEILKRAAMVITHAGPNTVLETLMEGVPMIAIPIAHDQPAIAARLARLKLAEVLPLRNLSSEKVRAAAEALLSNPRYGESARTIGLKMRSFRGAERAADIIEAALAKHEGGASGAPTRTYARASS
jgi:MGT family glycosyltransferase